MLEILGLSAGSISASGVLGGLGMLAAIVNIIVQVIKGFIPKKIPTQVVTIIVSLLVCIAFVFIFWEIGIKTLIIGVFMTPIVAFTSMNGFDTLKKIWGRFQIGEVEEKEVDE